MARQKKSPASDNGPVSPPNTTETRVVATPPADRQVKDQSNRPVYLILGTRRDASGTDLLSIQGTKGRAKRFVATMATAFERFYHRLDVYRSKAVSFDNE